MLPECPGRFAQFAVNVLGVAPQGDDTVMVLRGVEAMEDFYREIKMLTNLRLGLELTEEQVLELGEKCSVATQGNPGAVKPLMRGAWQKFTAG